MSENADTAVASAVERLVADSVLSPDQGAAVLREFTAEYHPPATAGDGRATVADGEATATNGEVTAAGRGPAARWSILAEVGGYIGAAFVVAAIAALIGPTWDRCSTLVKVGVLGGPGLLLAACAFAVAATMPGGWSWHPAGQTGPRRRLAGLLTLAAGGLLAAAVAVTTEHHGDRVYPVALLVLWGVGYALCRGPLLHLGSAAALVAAIFAILAPADDLRLPALVLVLAGAGWATLAALTLLDERDIGFLAAGVMVFVGAELFARSRPAAAGYLLLAVLAAVALTGYVRSQRVSMLAVGAVALGVVVPQAVVDYTASSLGVAGALLVCGLSIVAVSAFSLHLRRTVGA